MTIDKWGSDPEYVAAIKEEYSKIDKEIEDENMSVPLPEKLTKDIAEQLFREKEDAIKNIYSQLAQMMRQGGQQLTQAEFDQTIMINKTMFEDRMYVK